MVGSSQDKPCSGDRGGRAGQEQSHHRNSCLQSIKNPCISSRERSQTDKMVDGMDFEELCSDFECISSPYVESIMRQVARDIFELREDNRAFSCYAVPVKYEVFLCYVKSFTFCTLIGSFRLLV
eukprot:XP_020401566.1 uncharacterized protein LOC100303977 isoform X1 [Zea mays]